MEQAKVRKPFYEEGVYVGRVEAQGLGKSKTKGTPEFWLQFTVMGLPDGEDKYNPLKQQYVRTVHMYITEGTVPFVVENLELMQYPHSTFGHLDPSHPEHHSFKGKFFNFYCKHEEAMDGNGWMEKWQLSKPRTDIKPPEITALAPKDTRALDALFGKNLKGRKELATAKGDVDQKIERMTTTEQNQHGQYIDDDDIPF